MSDEWVLPEEGKTHPNLFLGDKEKDFAKQIGDEITERIVNQYVVYYPTDMERTSYHPVYGEAIMKHFLPPIRVHALIEWNGIEKVQDKFNLDKTPSINVHFLKRRIEEDQNLFVREGDFVAYGRDYYEIVKLDEPRQVFGAFNIKVEVTATCVKARIGTFEVNEDDQRK